MIPEHTIRNDGQRTWLCVHTQPAQPGPDNYQLKILESSQLISIFPGYLRQNDDSTLFEYDITDCIPLQHLFDKNALEPDSWTVFLQGMHQALNSCREYLLDPDSLLVYPEYIYMNLLTEQVCVCYLPGYKADFNASLAELLQQMLKHSIHNDRGFTEKMYAAADISSNQHYSPNAIWAIFESATESDGFDASDASDAADEFDESDGFDDSDGLDASDGFDGSDGLDASGGFDGSDGLDASDGFDGSGGLDASDGFDGSDRLDASGRAVETDTTDGFKIYKTYGEADELQKVNRSSSFPAPRSEYLSSESRQPEHPASKMAFSDTSHTISASGKKASHSKTNSPRQKNATSGSKPDGSRTRQGASRLQTSATRSEKRTAPSKQNSARARTAAPKSRAATAPRQTVHTAKQTSARLKTSSSASKPVQSQASPAFSSSEQRASSPRSIVTEPPAVILPPERSVGWVNAHFMKKSVDLRIFTDQQGYIYIQMNKKSQPIILSEEMVSPGDTRRIYEGDMINLGNIHLFITSA